MKRAASPRIYDALTRRRHRCRASVDPLSRISNPRATAINRLYWATPVRSEDPHMRCQHPWDRNGPGPGFTSTSSV